MDRRIRLSAALAAALAIAASCGPTPKPPAQPSNPYRAVGLVVKADGWVLDGASCSLQDVPGWTAPIVTNQDGYLVWLQVTTGLSTTAVRCSKDGYVPYEAPAVLRTSKDEDLPPITMLSERPPLPPIPTRDAVAGIRTTFQGLTVRCDPFGDVPWLDYYLTSPDVTPACRAASYAAKHAAGDTHQTINVSWAYREPGLVFAPAGRDLTNDLPTLKAYVREAVANGFKVDLVMAGDGESLTRNPDGTWPYNDPVGDTYGFAWLMANFPRLWAGIGPSAADADDLRPFSCARPGYDGVVPGWQPWSHVDDWLTSARAVVGPQGCLSLELSAGYWAWSGERDDYDTPAGLNLDAVLYEFPWQMGPPPAPPAGLLLPDRSNWAPTATNEQKAPWTQVWQISKRLLGPAWVRPPEQPPADDPGTAPDFRPRPGRGALIRVGYEYDTYGWVRGLVRSVVDTHRAYLRSIGWGLVG